MQVLSVGEILWDVFPDKELLGGAPLNFSANVVRLGGAASLISGIGNDRRGRLARQRMVDLGVDAGFVEEVPDVSTGVAVVRTSPGGEPGFEIPRPAAFDHVRLTPALLSAAKLLRPDWLYFGTLLQTGAHVEQMTRELADALPGMRCFYDMNLRPGGWNLPLIERLSAMADILKLNESEAATLGELRGMPRNPFSLEGFCREWAARYDIRTICVTLGDAGCLVYEQEAAHTIPGYPASVEDTVGAGDAFAAAFLHGYHQGWPLLRTARFANALGSIVASRPGATPAWTVEECIQLASVPPAKAHPEKPFSGD